MEILTFGRLQVVSFLQPDILNLLLSLYESTPFNSHTHPSSQANHSGSGGIQPSNYFGYLILFLCLLVIFSKTARGIYHDDDFIFSMLRHTSLKTWPFIYMEAPNKSFSWNLYGICGFNISFFRDGSFYSLLVLFSSSLYFNFSATVY